MPERDPVSAWNTGVTLLEAMEQFADPDLSAEYGELYHKMFPPIPSVDLRPLFRNTSPAPLPYDPVLDLLRLNSLGDKLKAQILESLNGGKLLAVGYALPRRRNQKPEWVQPDHWAVGLPNWDNSELWGRGYGYTDVRVIQAAADPTAIAASMPVPETRRPPGRPTHRHLIMQAYETLRDMDRIDYRSFSRNIPSIRELALRLSGEPSKSVGLGDETIRSTLSEEFKRDQEARGFFPKNHPRK